MTRELTLAFTAMDGLFPGACDVEALWGRVLRAEPAPATHLCARWGMSPERVLSLDAPSKTHAYTDLGFALPERAPEDALPASLCAGEDVRWGRQAAFTHLVLARLLATLPGTLDRTRLALVLATSWSDESAFLADDALTRAPLSPTDPGLDAAGQLEGLARELGVGGPTLAVDTACSSFVYALDAARALLEGGRADAVLVAGVNAFLPAPIYLGFSQLGALSRRGRLAAFDRDADGIVPGEAVAAVLLEPLDSARRAGRSALGILRALGLSCDGREGGVFAPGRAGQLRAYERAHAGQPGLEVDYVEAHGTGTTLGDRTELTSLDAFYGVRRSAGAKLPLGSVKRIVGHSLAAAGATSLIKALLVLRERTVPPHGVGEAAPELEASCFELPRNARPLPRAARPLRVALSSFGFGGGNGHLVLEEPPRAASLSAPLSAHAVLRLDTCIVALDGVNGGARTLAALRAQLSAEGAMPRAFPDRFGALSSAPRGHFFAGEHTVDADGLGIGPRPLSAIDPFKLLLVARVRHVLSELGLRGDENTAVVACANMGGGHFFTTYRAAEASHGRGEQPASALAVDDVPTLLPTMLSGYPAMFFDLKGFHCTLSGGARLFLDALLTAPHWLGTRCDTLVLAAGSCMASRADLVRRAGQGETPGEGAYAFALRRADALGGVRPLATLHAFVPAPASPSAFYAESPAWRDGPTREEVCELDARHIASSRVQQRTGHLAEATGAETLLASVLLGPGRVALSVRAGGQPVGTLFLEVHAAPHVRDEPVAKLPLTVRFSSPEHGSRAEPTLEAPPVRRYGLLAHLERVTEIVRMDLEQRRMALAFLRAQRAPRDLPAAPTPRALLRQDERHVVLESPVRTAEGLHARLRVPEDHPFHFDHPLDHVPGILLLEGMLQLLETARGSDATRARDWFVSSLDVRFRRYTEKHAPIELRLTPREPTSDAAIVVEQAGQEVCSARFTLSPVRTAASAHVERPAVRIPEARTIHKHRPENVLVGELGRDPRQLVSCTLPLPAGHALGDGDAAQLSMLYFLEVGRQTFMLNAHELWRIPLGVPMNLLHLRFSLDAPIPRDVPLTLRPMSEPLAWNGLMLTQRFAVGLELAGVRIGRGEFHAQAISPELYELQRRPHQESAA